MRTSEHNCTSWLPFFCVQTQPVRFSYVQFFPFLFFSFSPHSISTQMQMSVMVNPPKNGDESYSLYVKERFFEITFFSCLLMIFSFFICLQRRNLQLAEEKSGNTGQFPEYFGGSDLQQCRRLGSFSFFFFSSTLLTNIFVRLQEQCTLFLKFVCQQKQ
jgi:hypothetical protein